VNQPPPVGQTVVQLKIGDAAADQLLSFAVTLDSLTAVPGSGQQVNLVSAPIAMELTHMAGTRELLASVNVPQGSYNAIQYGVSNFLVRAWDPTTSAFQDYTDPGPFSGTIPLNPAVTLSSAPVIVNLDLDLQNSIAISSGAISITPHFTVTNNPVASADSQIAETGRAEDLVGMVTAVSGTSFTLALPGSSITVATDSQTQGEPVSMVVANAIVGIDAVTNSDGDLLAKRIDFVETGGVALVEGVVTDLQAIGPTGGDTATIRVRDRWGTSLSQLPNVGDQLVLSGLLRATYSFDADKLDSSYLPVLSFDNLSFGRGQEILAVINPGTGNVLASKVKLVETPAAGIVYGYNPSQVRGFTLLVPQDSALQNMVQLMPQTYLTTWDQLENKTDLEGFPQATPMQDGMQVRVRGLAFWYAPQGYTPGGPTVVATRIDYLSSPAK